MFEWVWQLLVNIGLTWQINLLAYLLSLSIILLISFALRFILRFLFNRIALLLSRRDSDNWNAVFVKRKVYRRLANMLIPILLAIYAEDVPIYHDLTLKLVNIVSVVAAVFLLSSLLDAFGDLYRRRAISRVRPLKGVLQISKVALMIFGAVVAVAIVAGENPLALLGGVGAMTAVTSLIFKDAILGFVAGIQLTGNDMVRIGDWVEIPGQAADGTVIDLSLTTVQVENFDNTVTSIPAYALISNAFINYRNMEQSGGRRIKRAIFIDAASVKIADREMIERFRSIRLINGYIDKKLLELERYNATYGYGTDENVNGRRLTNVGTFRAYINAYLHQHPGIHQQMIIMVRQLAPEQSGLPLEVYAFTNTVEWKEYETIQADIFDHIYAVAEEFGLSIYQQPSSRDIRALAPEQKQS